MKLHDPLAGEPVNSVKNTFIEISSGAQLVDVKTADPENP